MKFGSILMLIATIQALIGWIFFLIFKNQEMSQFWMGWGMGNNILQIIALVVICIENPKPKRVVR